MASLPPEQMFELMKQMKMCIQNNPQEARNMLLQVKKNTSKTKRVYKRPPARQVFKSLTRDKISSVDPAKLSLHQAVRFKGVNNFC